MNYEVKFQARAIKDLRSLSQPSQRRIIEKIEAMRIDLAGDVKRLMDFTPEYRLRVGDHRVLSEIESTTIIIDRVKYCSDAYRP